MTAASVGRPAVGVATVGARTHRRRTLAHPSRVAARTTTAAPSIPLPSVAPAATAVRTTTLVPSPGAALFLRWSRRVAVGGWLGLIAMVAWGVQSGALTSVSRLRDVLDGFGPVAPAVYTLMGATEAVFPVLPGSATIIAAPILFGPVVGLLTAYLATCLGSVAVFALSRHVGQDLLHARFRAATVERWLGWLRHRHFARWFAVAIVLPVAPDDLLCYLAGLSQMRWRTFVLIIVLLKPWALIIYTFGVLTLLSRWIPWLAG